MRTESGTDLFDHIQRSGKVRIAEEYPAETNIDKKGVENYEITFDPVKAQYVKVVIKRSPALPKGHAGEGKAAYMFIDEIEVD